MDNEIKIKIDQEENESNKFHIKKIEEIFEQFSSRPTGLSKSEVEKKNQKFEVINFSTKKRFKVVLL